MTPSSNNPARARRATLIVSVWGVAVLAALLLIVLAVWLFSRPRQRTFWTDAESIRAAGDAAPRMVLWQPPRPLAELRPGPVEQYEPRLSWDGRTLFFVRGKAGENADICIAERTPAGWSEPRPLDAINTPADELGPCPSFDGQTLYFYSDRPGGAGGYDIWLTTRSGDAWSAPVNLGPQVNSPWNDYGPAVAPDGRTLYFASNRPPPDENVGPQPDAWPATIREEVRRWTYDLYAAALGGEAPGPAVPLDVLNTAASEGAPCLSPAGDFLYFCSDRPGGLGGFDLYRARVVRGQLQPPQNLGSPVNTPDNELDPALSDLGFGLCFSSDRAPADAPPPMKRTYQLFQTSSREVFLERESMPGAPINWTQLAASIAPWLGWLVLGLLALLALLALLRDATRRKLSLLTRCLLVSLLAHAALLVAMSMYKVSQKVIEVVGARPSTGGGIRVSLAAAGSLIGDIAGQVRGRFVDFSISRPADADASPLQPAAVVEALDLSTEPPTPVSPIDIVGLTVRTEPPRPAPAGLVVSSLPDTVSPAPMPASLFSSPQLAPQPAAPETPSALPVAPTLMTASAAPALPTAAAPPAFDEPPLPAPAETTGRGALAPLAIAAPASASTLSALPAPSPEAAIDRPPAALALRSPRSPAHRSAADAAAAADAPIALPIASLDATALAPGGLLRPASNDPATPAAPPLDAGSLAAAPIPAATLPEPAASAAAVVPHATPAPTVATSPFSSLAAPRSPGPAAPPQTESDAQRAPSLSVTPAPLATVSGPSLAAAQPAPPAVETLPLPPNSGRSTPPSLAVSAPRDRPAQAPSPRPAAAPAAAAPLLTARAPEAPATLAPAEDTTGVVTGQVRAAGSGRPLEDAVVRVDRSGAEPLTARTDADGWYELPLPDLPEHFAISASHDRALPLSRNVRSAALSGRRLRLDFELEPLAADVLALEPEPTVHHLGNDRFEGVINSQFQRGSEGRSLVLHFSLAPEQRARRRARLTLMSKGVQCAHEIRVNGVPLERPLESSPRDGSFGAFSARVPMKLLRTGENALELTTSECWGDIDDYEFVNVQIRFED